MDPQVEAATVRLKALSGAGLRSKTAKVRDLLPMIEELKTSGFTNEQIRLELEAAGLAMSLKTFESLLHRARKTTRKRQKGCEKPGHPESGPRRAVPTSLTASRKPSNPADLRQLLESATEAANEAF